MFITHIGHSWVRPQSRGCAGAHRPRRVQPRVRGAHRSPRRDPGHPCHTWTTTTAERLPALLDANDGARLVAEPEVAAELVRGAGAGRRAPAPLVSSTSLGGLDVAAVGGVHALIHDEVPRIGNIGSLMLSADGEAHVFDPGDTLRDGAAARSTSSPSRSGPVDGTARHRGVPARRRPADRGADPRRHALPRGPDE